MSKFISPLTDRAVFEISGNDAGSFLQGLVTGDIESLGNGEARHVGLLTPQGKIMFYFFVIGQTDGYLIDCPADQIDELVKRLTFYKLRAEVRLAKCNDLKVSAGWGDVKESDLSGIVFEAPRLVDMGWRAISTQQVSPGSSSYHAHRIALGVPDSIDIGSGETFPHEANFDQLNGVSFTKGCYVGQEVVSRMQHRGTTKSRILKITGNVTLETGVEIRGNEKRIGQVLSVAGQSGLAMMRLDRAKSVIDTGKEIRAGGTVIEVSRPTWADFEF